jgi:phosphinothricin acetyltransferase
VTFETEPRSAADVSSWLAAGRTLCRALGLREVGVHRRHAWLDGEWRDCVIVELLLGT